MVTQPQVQAAVEAIAPVKPVFTMLDVMDWLVEQKLIPVQVPGKNSHRANVGRILQILKSWEVIDRLPQGHQVKCHIMWYLKKNGNPHILPCKICSNRDKAWAIRYRQLMIRIQSNRIKLTPEQDRYVQGLVGDENYY